MHLKSIEIIGFKSFANKTKLELKPGITSIVGPNGCGKSNISDAVRWVLGEQRARVLRGTKMEDIIFNGTENSKPMGMAEVSITLTDCNKTLDTEYNEVCVTRRVFRSGDSGYFLNRKACRLKDIQRLFMDTGIGTDSYSILEQGKIDQILSAKPEDRRSVFEEASGITKFKTDKKEALRKLEHTDANLLRLEDVIREVKRQIISLQRQAGKARRYKEMAAEKRSLDIYTTKNKLIVFNEKSNEYEKKINDINNYIESLQKDISQIEEKSVIARNALSERENNINNLIENAAKARSELEQSKRIIFFNNDRIKEIKELINQNSDETDKAKIQLGEYENDLINFNKSHQNQTEFLITSKKELDDALENQKKFENENSKLRDILSKMRSDSIEIESKIAKLHNNLNQLDAQDRERLIKRERLATENSQTKENLKLFNDRINEINAKINKENSEIHSKELKLNKLENNKEELEIECRTKEIKKILSSFIEKKISLNETVLEILSVFKKRINEQDQIDHFILEIEKLKQIRATKKGEIQAIDREKDILKKRIDTTSYELGILEKNSKSTIDLRINLTNEIEKEKTKQSQLRTDIINNNNELIKSENMRKEIFEYTSEKQINFSEIKHAQEQYEFRKSPLESRINELKILIENRSSGIHDYKIKLNNLMNEIQNSEKQINPLTDLVSSTDLKLSNERENRKKYLENLTESEDKLKQERTNLEKYQKEYSSLNIKKTELLMSKKNLVERINNSYHIDIENIEYEPLPSEWDDKNIANEEVIENRIAEIQAKLDLMGPINLIAIEEHAEFEERYSLLMKEQSDLLTAKQQLLEMIKKINNTTTELFKSTFNKVNNEFQEMFKILFKGGSAKLVLTDEDDILEAGIEIIAKPPGKKLQSISLLSGGERTMTAVALLFSLFKVKPSPFCVLDELDAALDDSNIARFIKVLNTFVSSSQFLIITHNKHTIEKSDVIFGVTMQSKGMSKLVSMQFSDYDKNKKQLTKV